MENLKVGTEVATVDSNSEIVYRRILSFSHHEKNGSAKYTTLNVQPYWKGLTVRMNNGTQCNSSHDSFHAVTMSEDHLIPAIRYTVSREKGYTKRLRLKEVEVEELWENAEMVRASSVGAGDIVFVVPDCGSLEEYAKMVPSHVRYVHDMKTPVKHGLYNPHTASGSIIVDNFAVTCHTEGVDVNIANFFQRPMHYLMELVFSVDDFLATVQSWL